MWCEEEYGGVNKLYVPSDEIWLPDIVLYNRLVSLYAYLSLSLKMNLFDFIN